MGLEELRGEILEKAEREAKAILDKADAEAAGIIRQAQQQVSEVQKQAKLESQKALENLERKELAKANFEVKKQVLGRKQAIIDDALEEARSMINSMDRTKRSNLFSKLLAKATVQMDIATVYINPKDKDLVKSYSWLSADIMGGLIVENRDKSMRIDYSFDTMLESAVSRNMSEIVKVIFRQ